MHISAALLEENVLGHAKYWIQLKSIKPKDWRGRMGVKEGSRGQWGGVRKEEEKKEKGEGERKRRKRKDFSEGKEEQFCPLEYRDRHVAHYSDGKEKEYRRGRKALRPFQVLLSSILQWEWWWVVRALTWPLQSMCFKLPDLASLSPPAELGRHPQKSLREWK